MSVLKTSTTNLLVALAVLFSSSAQAIAADTSGLYLEQSAPRENRLNIWVTPQAVRIDNTTNGYSIASKAPEWQVYFWRTDQKIYCVTPFKAWCNTAFRSNTWTCDLTKPIGRGTNKLMGKSVTVYRYGSTPQVGVFMRTSIGDDSNRDDVNHAEISQMAYPGSEHTGPIISCLQRVPALPGLTLAALRYRENGRIEGAISTAKIEERKNIAATLFDCPQNFNLKPFNLIYMRTAANRKMEMDFVDNFMR